MSTHWHENIGHFWDSYHDPIPTILMKWPSFGQDFPFAAIEDTALNLAWKKYVSV